MVTTTFFSNEDRYSAHLFIATPNRTWAGAGWTFAVSDGKRVIL